MKRLVFFVAALFAVCLGAMAQPHASILSYGNYNTATIKQSAAENWATIVQDLRTSEYNRATITQCYANSFNNRAAVFQTMRGNTADVKQSGRSNFIRVEQWGNQGLVDLVQGGAGNEAYVNQYQGPGNIVTFRQFGTDLDATIIQKGMNNEVALKQGGSRSDININQDGFGNSVKGITDRYAFLGGNDAILDVDQLGQRNTLRLWSGVPGATVAVYQNGIENLATVYQGPSLCIFPTPTFPVDPCCENVH